MLLALTFSTIYKNAVGMNLCNEKVSRKENWTFMTDSAKNIIILRLEETLKVSFTKLSGVLKKVLTRYDEDHILGGQVLYDGLLPVDIKKPLFEKFNLELSQRELDDSSKSSSPREEEKDQCMSLMDIILETIDGKSMGSKLLYKISHKNLNRPVQESDKKSIDFELY